MKNQEFKVGEGIGRTIMLGGPFYLVSKLPKLIGTPYIGNVSVWGQMLSKEENWVKSYCCSR